MMQQFVGILRLVTSLFHSKKTKEYTEFINTIKTDDKIISNDAEL